VGGICDTRNEKDDLLDALYLLRTNEYESLNRG
jgi:hypothetical protein